MATRARGSRHKHLPNLEGVRGPGTILAVTATQNPDRQAFSPVSSPEFFGIGDWGFFLLMPWCGDGGMEGKEGGRKEEGRRKADIIELASFGFVWRHKVTVVS